MGPKMKQKYKLISQKTQLIFARGVKGNIYNQPAWLTAANMKQALYICLAQQQLFVSQGLSFLQHLIICFRYSVFHSVTRPVKQKIESPGAMCTCYTQLSQCFAKPCCVFKYLLLMVCLLCVYNCITYMSTINMCCVVHHEIG